MKATPALHEIVRSDVEFELRTLRPFRDNGWEVRTQECEFGQSLDDFMNEVRERKGEEVKCKRKGWRGKGKYS